MASVDGVKTRIAGIARWIRSPKESARRALSLATHRIHALPVLILMPHSRCNCRCLMCDIWKSNGRKQELSRQDFERHVSTLRRLRVRRCVLSGGEALMHSDLWSLCRLLQELGIRMTLLSTGLLLKRHAREILRFFDHVIVSLDGGPPIHDSIRNVPRAYEQLAAGVDALKGLAPELRVTARCVIQRRNYHDLPGVIDAARALNLDQLSFLAADVSTEAFNRPQPWDAERASQVALRPDEAQEFARLVEQVLVRYGEEFERGFIAESPEKMRNLASDFLAQNGGAMASGTATATLTRRRCNAPWVSAVVEADGEVRPCFFHPALGNLHHRPLEEILNSEKAVTFRRRLDVAQDPICRRCVCTLHLAPWTQDRL